MASVDGQPIQVEGSHERYVDSFPGTAVGFIDAVGGCGVVDGQHQLDCAPKLVWIKEIPKWCTLVLIGKYRNRVNLDL